MCIKNSLLSKIKLSLLFLVVFFLSTGLSFAESVFLKDGKIIEGTIIKETDRATEIKTSDGQRLTISRKDILRTVVNTSYKTKMYIMKSDKSVIAVYIVDEDNESYTYRIELQSPDETKIKKENVLFISKIPPQEFIQEKEAQSASGKTKYSREEEVKFRAPLLRVGISNMTYYDKELEDLFPDASPGILFDLFFYRFRGPISSGEGGLDLMFRFKNHGRKADLNSTDSRTSRYNQLYNISITGPYSSDFFLTLFSLGARSSWGFYKYVHFQPYAFLLFTTGKFSSMLSANGIDTEYEKRVNGIEYGLGIDIGIFPYFGIFAEYNGGWLKSKFPNGEEYNFDANAIYFGASFRTSYGLLE